MQAIRVLEEEHRAIERVLDALDGYAASGQEASTPETRKDLLEFVEFIRLFADRVHHGKEEDILFEEMIRAGFQKDMGPLAVMLHEHERGRLLADKLGSLGEVQAPWSPADRATLKAAASDYTKLLRQHIHKEDNILYPMAEARLGAEGMSRVENACADFERRQEQSGEKQRLLSMGVRLAERYAAKGVREGG